MALKKGRRRSCSQTHKSADDSGNKCCVSESRSHSSGRFLCLLFCPLSHSETYCCPFPIIHSIPPRKMGNRVRWRTTRLFILFSSESSVFREEKIDLSLNLSPSPDPTQLTGHSTPSRHETTQEHDAQRKTRKRETLVSLHRLYIRRPLKIHGLEKLNINTDKNYK